MTRSSNRSPDLDNLIHTLLFLCILVLFGGMVLVFFEMRGLAKVTPSPSGVNEVQTPKSDCGENCKVEIGKMISDAVATITAVPKTIVKVSPAPQGKQTSYIPLPGTGSTEGNEWVDVSSTDVWIDLKDEYSESAYVDWEASILNSSISGKTFVRLYDVTNKTPVSGSEISSNSTASTRVSSGRLNLWVGHNLYRVQIRSLAPYKATFEGGKIKIVY